MNAFSNLLTSTVGKKVVMAATGLAMIGWLTIHMAGNLIVFAGQDAFNEYAHFIQSGFGIEPALLWLMRAAMLGIVVSHIWAAISLTRTNAAARPVDYAAGRQNRVTSYAAVTMKYGGLVLLMYIVFHLLHLTVGVWEDNALMPVQTFDRTNAYANLIGGVGVPAVGIVYILANLALGAHLYHGTSSGLQTLGLNDPGYNGLKLTLTKVVPVLIAGGNILIALAILGGVVAEPDPNWSADWAH